MDDRLVLHNKNPREPKIVTHSVKAESTLDVLEIKLKHLSRHIRDFDELSIASGSTTGIILLALFLTYFLGFF